jgi:hypothetical protein
MSASKIPQNHSILLVKDDPNEVFNAKRALMKRRISNSLNVVNEGEKVILFLRKDNEYKDSSTPGMILRDLHICARARSYRDKDVDETYQHGCNRNIMKPVSFDNFIKTICEIQEYWLCFSRIPTDIK